LTYFNYPNCQKKRGKNQTKFNQKSKLPGSSSASVFLLLEHLF